MPEQTWLALLDLLDLKPTGDHRWVAPTPSGGHPHLYGGQMSAQALFAACQTVTDGRVPHVVQIHFLRAGVHGEEMELSVERTREGRSFATRGVIGRQAGETTFSMVAAFHADEAGFEWQEELIPARSPDDAEAYPDSRPSPRTGGPFLVRRVNPDNDRESWVRLIDPLEDDRVLQSCALVYASDFGTVQATVAPGHPATRAMTSLNLSVWMHRSMDMNDWHLIRGHPVSNAGARGLSFGSIHSADGRRVASIADELMIRPA